MNGETQLFVNVGLLLVKCMLLQSREDTLKSEAVNTVDLCCRALEKYQKGFMDDVMLDRSYAEDESDDMRDKEHVEKFNWMLTALSIVAGFYNSLGHQKKCEQSYVKCIQYVSSFKGLDDFETGNSYY